MTESAHTSNLRQSHTECFVSRWQFALKLQDQRVREQSEPLQRQVDLDMYVLALRNLVRAVEYAQKVTGESEIENALEEFKRAIPGWLNVRDFIEHFDEYSLGTGRRQQRNEANVYGPYYAEEERYDVEGALISRNFYLSFGEGNQIDVLTTTREANKMADIALRSCIRESFESETK